MEILPLAELIYHQKYERYISTNKPCWLYETQWRSRVQNTF
jgi:hypothetical protein